MDNNLKEATKMQLEAIPLIDTLFSEVNPIPVKALLNEIGFDFGIPRLPLTPISEKNLEKLEMSIWDRFLNGHFCPFRDTSLLIFS